MNKNVSSRFFPRIPEEAGAEEEVRKDLGLESRKEGNKKEKGGIDLFNNLLRNAITGFFDLLVSQSVVLVVTVMACSIIPRRSCGVQT